ncbi:MAG TPA: HlyD family efflux transporter periplasmic adaptor subunit [Candidatus Pacebacteria bacterium]|nr:HlyD family efflux transporter periplasmic adaptor subunit [Candidatus Paceibacterota bacterium]
MLNKFYELSDLLYLNSKNLLGLSSGELEELEKKTLGIKTQIDGKKIILENLNSSYTSQRLAKDISQANFDKTRNGSREEDLESARISIELAENSIAKIQNLILKKTIVSPTDGIISRVDVNVGENISGGVPVIRIIKGKKILTSVPVDLSKKLFLGQEIKVNFLRGKISKIYPMSDNFGLVDLEIKILEKNNFEIGEFVKILIPEKIDKKSDNIILPLASIFEKKEKYFIYLLDNKLIAQEKEVEFVKLFGDGIMVKNSFKDEDRIILNSRGVSEGDKF